MRSGWLAALWDRIRRPAREETVGALRDRLARFRDLVDKNNLVLELIADGGEKLSGEYVFDMQYLRTLAARLEEAVRAVVFDLNAVTGNRHLELVDRLQPIAADVRALLEGRCLTRSSQLVIPLDRADADLADVVGAKMARLSELRLRLGVTVPDGFVITAHACQRALRESGVERFIERAAGQPDAGGEHFWVERSASLEEQVLNARLPRDLVLAIRRALAGFKRADCLLAVRSSALGEDGAVSFAGQYTTVLGVAPEQVPEAYKQVLASLFSPAVMQYRLRHRLDPVRCLMAVGCLRMVEARASGVMYTLDPSQPSRETVVITAARGLGKTVVEGLAPVDRFEVSRLSPLTVVNRSVGTKKLQYVAVPGRGLESVALAEEEQTAPAVSDAELLELARIGLAVEGHARCAQDVEWAVDLAGHVSILQARPLRLDAGEEPDRDLADLSSRYPVLLQGQGVVACRGIGFGPAHVLEDDQDLDNLPSGVVLVARTSTPRLAAAMARASAVVTDVGTATGHLAAIARELRVPAIMDTGIATRTLAGAGPVTVDAEENIVYQGRVDELLRYQLLRQSSYSDGFEFGLLRRLLRRVAPLNLVDPQSALFTAARCTTFHDVIRFAHEKAVQHLAEGSWVRPSASSPCVRTLKLEIPLDLVLVDLGDGFQAPGSQRSVGPECVTSAPLRALLEGLLEKGVWVTEPADMDLNGFMSSMARSSMLTGPASARPEQNLAIVSGHYLNLSLHLGYHFNIVDSYLSEARSSNYLYFRFAGGVTELARRSRRASFLKKILELNDFVLEGQGDLVIGRLKKVGCETMVERLKMIGRLVGFSRQLDIFLRSDELVDHCVTAFMEGRHVAACVQ